MQYSKVSELPIIEDADAEGVVAHIYEEYKREMQNPYVPNIYKGLAVSPAALSIQWDFTRSVYKNTTLPESLVFMILYTIAEFNNCQYCSAGNAYACRILGIDEDTISAMANDLENLSPHRIREIIKFALKVSHNPQGLVAEDYQRVRDSGVMDEEIVEIIQVAAIAKYNDIIADSLKIAVDPMISSEPDR